MLPLVEYQSCVCLGLFLSSSEEGYFAEKSIECILTIFGLLHTTDICVFPLQLIHKVMLKHHCIGFL